MQNLLLCSSFQNEIIVLEKDYSKYLVCLVREHRISLNNEPEEYIRQCLLFYLLNLSNLYPELIDIQVEFRNADIVIFPCLPSDFKPELPVAIIETKVALNVESNIGQIKGYLSEFRCKTGFLFDGNKLIHIENDKVTNLSSLHDLKAIVEDKLSHISFEADYSTFLEAKSGSIDSFNILSKKYP